jgi:subtilisin family serine protease
MLLVLAIIGTLMGLLFWVYWRAIATTELKVPYVSTDTLAIAAESGTPLHVPAPAPPKKPEFEPKYVPDQYMVLFDKTVADAGAEAKKLVASFAEGRVVHVYDTPKIKACNVSIPRIAPAHLEKHPGVKGAEQETMFTRRADSRPTGILRIGHANSGSHLVKIVPGSMGLPNVVNGSLNRTRGRGIVAVIDGGVDPNHRDLNVTRTIPMTGTPFVVDDHGTHVAGTIGAKANGAGVVGVFPGVEIWSLDVFGTAPFDAFFGDLANCLVFVRNNGAQIKACNMSVGSLAPPVTVAIINGLVDQCSDAGVIMVAAAGNRSLNLDFPVIINGVPFFDAPATADTVICVGALADSDGKWGGNGPGTFAGADDTYADFSDFGDTVEVIGPGVDIISTMPGNRYGSNTGTSMSSPHICGLMALYHGSVVRDAFLRSRPATGKEIAAMFLQHRGGELFPGPGNRLYPLMVEPGKRP